MGADQDRSTSVEATEVLVSPVGAPGALEVDEDVGVADISFDVEPGPAEFTAETR